MREELRRVIRTETCMWCGGTDMSGEDVIPRWIGRSLRKVVPPGEDVWLLVDHKKPDDEDATLIHRRKIGAPSGPKRKVVCDDCNRGWMKRLEDDVKPVIENMILGSIPSDGISLSDADLDTVRRWITKTSLINYFVSQSPPCDPSVYNSFYESQAPSPYSRMWLMAHFPEQGELMKLWPTPLGRHASNGGPQMILFTAYIGWFAFQFVTDVQVESLTRPSGRNVPDPVIFEIWPNVENRTWPPETALNSEGVEMVAENKIGPPRQR